MINIALCCSPLQVLNAAAAIKLDSRSKLISENIVCIHHPNLRGANKKIEQLAYQLGFQRVCDFTKEAGILGKLQSQLSPKAWFVSDRPSILSSIDEICADMQKEVFKNGREDVCIYSRKVGGSAESLFLEKILQCRNYSIIEDGFGNNIPSGFAPQTYLLKKNQIKKLIFKNWIKICGVDISYLPHLEPDCFFAKKSFTISKFEGSISILKPVKELLVDNFSTPKINGPRVYLLGTLFERIHLNRIVREYKLAVERICQHHGIGPEDIMFKPHHRASGAEIEILKLELGCKFDNAELPLLECYFPCSQIDAIYSHESTGCLNAKRIFNIDSYYIDSQLNRKDHLHWRKIKYVSEKFNIGLFNIQ